MVYKFQLSEQFIDQYKNKKVSWGPIGEFIFLRTYSRKIDEEDRNEKWWETVKRVVEGTFNIQKEHCARLRLPWKNPKAQRSAQIMYNKIFNFKFTPAGRGLWMMGTKFLEERNTSTPLFNCAAVSTHDIDVRGSFAFVWAFDSLMLGVGVGFDTRGAGKIVIKQPKENNGLVFQIPDSREGWTESLELLLDAFFYGKQLPKFEYDLIRPYGEPIKGFGGTASGPGPLKDMHQNIKKLLTKKIGEEIGSVDIVDIMDFIGACVVAGNVRRSALLGLGNYEDKDYLEMKDPKKYSKELKSHRWCTNNSIFAEVGKIDYNMVVNHLARNGEPGIVWVDNLKNFGRLNGEYLREETDILLVNPCGETTLESLECCNLCETYPSLHDSYEEYQETLKYAYLYAKTVTLIPTHWEEANAVMMKNRRIGISQTGIIDAFKKHGRRKMLEWSDNGYKYMRKLDKIYSNWFCIPRSKKITVVKPAGTTSQLAGVSPGIHYPHAEYYIRRVRIASNSPLLKSIKEAGYQVEPSLYGTDKTKENTVVVEFPVNEKNFSRRKEDVSIWEQVKNAVDYQRYWADNNVSITVSFKPEEKDDIVKVLEAYEDKLKAISFLPLSNHGYEQAPYEEITKEQYEKMISKLKPINFSNVVTLPEGEKFCDSDSCVL